MSEAPTQGRFPKFVDKHKDDWKKLVSGDTPDGDIWFRVTEDTNKKIDLAIKAKKRETAVGRNIRSLLDQHQGKFNLHGAGVTMIGGPIPLFAVDADGNPTDEIEAYEQSYRYTKRIV